MNKIFLFIFFTFFQAYCASPVWLWEKSLSLEKEQIYKAHFQVGGVQKELLFRWTLFKNQGLVLHFRYDKFNHQLMFYTDYQRNSYKLPLGTNHSVYKDEPHLLVYFKSFQDDKAHFNLYIEGEGVAVLDEEIQGSSS